MDKFNFLNDQEKLAVEQFYNNELQRDALKKVLLVGLYNSGVAKAGGKHNGNENWVYSLPWKIDGTSPISNETLGAEVRAISEGIRLVESVFVHELPKFKSPVPLKEKKNPGR